MNLLDWILAGAAAFSVLRGIVRGAVSQIFGILGILGGFFVAAHKYEQVGVEIRNNFPSLAGAGTTIAFILLFLLTWLCIAVAGSWIAKLMRRAGLGFVDRIWGGMIGFGKALLFAVVAVSILTLFGTKESPLLAGSLLTPYINEVTVFLLKIAPDKVQDEFSRKRESLKNILEKTSLPLNPATDSSKDNKGKK